TNYPNPSGIAKKSATNLFKNVVFIVHSIYTMTMGRTKEDPLFNRIEAARVARGLSRQQLADAVGVHYQTVGYLERGEYSPSLTLAIRLASELGCRVEELFSVRPFY
ncbi:MAG: helix-turn-helix transcriptional regulator, partial [Burkholderiales bacterium]